MELQRLNLVLLWLCKADSSFHSTQILPLLLLPLFLSQSAVPLPWAKKLEVSWVTGNVLVYFTNFSRLLKASCSEPFPFWLCCFFTDVTHITFLYDLGRRICCFKPATTATTEIANFLLMGQISLCYWGSQSIIVSNSVIAIFNPSFRDLWSVI